jgi:hypothetical protein
MPDCPDLKVRILELCRRGTELLGGDLLGAPAESVEAQCVLPSKPVYMLILVSSGRTYAA